VVISGDLTDYGKPAQVEEFKKVLDNSAVDFNKTKLIFAIGNHEYYDSQINGAAWKGGYLFKDVLGDIAYQGAVDSEIAAGDYHTVVNGQDFIVVNCSKYDGGVHYLDSDIKWLKEKLADAAANHPGKPIFVISHPQITGTQIGSNEGSYWASDELKSILKDYPQVIYFCGHMHFPENDERSIWQGDFTTIEVGSVYYCSNVNTDEETGKLFIDISYGYVTGSAGNSSQGLYVEVDNIGNVRVRRINFTKSQEIKKPWIVGAPKEDKSHLLYYTPEQIKKNFAGTAPVFSDGAYVKEIGKYTRGMEVYKFQFTQAKDNDMVYSYQLSFVNRATDTVITTISCLSDFYLFPNPEDMAATLLESIASANTILAPFTLQYKEDYYLKLVALDCFGQKSEPLISSIIDDVSDDIPVVPSGINLEQNYPNPFNPSTTINYSIPENSYITLKLYDVLGNEVKTLVKGNQEAGLHTITLNSSDLSSGVYFYKLNAGRFTSIKKMIKLN